MGGIFGAILAVFAGPVSGTFVTLDECRPLEAWQADFALMDQIGIETILVREAVDVSGGRAFYPTAQPGLTASCDYDAVGAILNLAEVYAMEAYLGLAYPPGAASPRRGQGGDAFLYRSAATAEELHQRYGGARSFAGWYLTPEITVNYWIADHNHHSLTMHRDLVAAIRRFDSRPIASAPYFIANSRYIPIAPADLRNFMFDYAIRTGVNLVILQDGIGGGGHSLDQVDAYFRAAAAGLEDTGAALWADIEAFEIPDDKNLPYLPASSQRFRLQADYVAPYVAETVIWTFQHYLSPNSGRPGDWQAFLSYLTKIDFER